MVEGSDPDRDVDGEAEPLAPEDLDIEDRDGIRKRGEGRYVVATDSESDPPPTRPREGGVEAAPEDALAAADAAYGVEMAVKTESGVARTTVTSNSVVEVFGEAMAWYAEQVDDSLPPAEVLATLLDESALDVDR